MSFPNLTLKIGGVLRAEADGIPVNGNNTFNLSIPSKWIDTTDWLDIEASALGPGITNVNFVSISQNKQQITLDFTQMGNDTARVVIKLNHSIVR